MVAHRRSKAASTTSHRKLAMQSTKCVCGTLGVPILGVFWYMNACMLFDVKSAGASGALVL